MTETDTIRPSLNQENIDRSSQVWERARRSDRVLSDEAIMGILTNDLKVGGDKVLFIKNYLDGVPMDDSDNEVAVDDERIAGLHDQLIDMVKGNLIIALEPSIMEQAKKVIGPKRQEYIDLLESYKEVYRSFQAGYNGDDVVPAITLSGFMIPVNGGVIDLTSIRPQGVRLNMHFQREMAGMFVHWDTAALMRMKNRNQRPKTTRRIYLNPRAEALVPIFTQIMNRADAAGLPIHGKVWERSYEFQMSRRSKSDSNHLRGDGIVLYSDDENADQLLAIVEQIYSQHEENFTGRRVSRIPFPIAEGVSAGDEPKESGASLTSSRSELLEEVQLAVHRNKEISTDPDKAILLFRELLRKKAIERGYNPNNLAFNL